MDDPVVRYQSGIPLGHKLAGLLIALVVAGAGCAFLIYQSGRSASTAVLALSQARGQQLDSGIASANYPTVALADTMLSDRTIASLTSQADLASSTPAAQIGEFRSDLLLSQPSAGQLDVRFQAANASRSIAVANDVAHALAEWTPPAAVAPAPQTPPQAKAPTAPPLSARQDSAHAAADGTQSKSAGSAAPDHPLSASLTKLGAQLSATRHQLDRMSASGGSSPYMQSAQQSLLRSAVARARGTMQGFRTQYTREIADPDTRARLDETYQALSSILPGTDRRGFNAAGVSGWELTDERSELSQAIRIVTRETKGIQAEEAAHPVATTQPAAAATPPQVQPASVSPPPAFAQSPTPAVHEQNLPPMSSSALYSRLSGPNPWRILHLAAPARRPALWPAFVAGALCGLLYLGIAAFAYRRSAGDYLGDDLYVEPGPQRMITPADPVSINGSPVVPPEAPDPTTTPRQRAAFVFPSAPPDQQNCDRSADGCVQSVQPDQPEPGQRRQR
jgi:hypothetical protein